MGRGGHRGHPAKAGPARENARRPQAVVAPKARETYFFRSAMDTVATIGPIALAVPQHRLTQDDVKQAVAALVPLASDRREAVFALFDAAGVNQRHSVLPLAALHRRRDLTETMDLYRTHAVALARQVASECLRRAELPPAAIDLIISVSCTGVMLPSLDAYLANDLGFRPDVRRLPITELGCLGGAAALSYARDFVAAHPGANVLVVSVELPTLSFQSHDLSPANLISTALFGDAAAAALVSGRHAGGARILDTASHLFPGTLEALGFDLESDGFHVVLGRELPGLVRADIARLVDGLLARNGLERRQLRAFALHPGGRRILDAVEEQLQLAPEDTRPSREILRSHGNLSSATVFFVLDEWMTRRRPPAGAHGLLGAFGPGFSSELAVLQWT
jgi:alkylresorcinol/alkylpyrone synthase